MKSLAIKYRPKSFDEVTEQKTICRILEYQLDSGKIKNAYLFCGPAGCGKTTCARIFATEINKGIGTTIEMDAASQNGVDDVREIIRQARTKSINSEYKVFIIDECHSFSNNAWQAMLKIIEEPPLKSIFIFCTTDPQKIPKTILSRVQRFDFQRISQKGIVDRLEAILMGEYGVGHIGLTDSLEYIAKLADGGMRDAITLLDKCLDYSTELTVENIVKALGTVDYEVMCNITRFIVTGKTVDVMDTVEKLYSDGKDLKQFIKSYIQFIVDVLKYIIGVDWNYINIPKIDVCENSLDFLINYEKEVKSLLNTLIKLQANIKYSSTPRYDVEAELLLESMKGEN